MVITAYSRITGNQVLSDGKPVSISASEKGWLTDIYNTLGVHYPKFFKMDALCKAGFLAAELVMPGTPENPEPVLDTAVIVFNRSASLENDTAYSRTITPENYFPSPALFVYTLPNIVTGEIAIRHKTVGESACYISENFDAGALFSATAGCFAHTDAATVLCGWVEVLDGTCDVLMLKVGRDGSGLLPFTEENIQHCYLIKQ